MSAITVDGDLVHYEVLGRGRPVVLLHGWIGSWRYWIPTMQQLHLKYRVYALDLYGFGDSSKKPEKYTLEQQTRLLAEFMRQQGLPKAAMIGHGLGALVLTEFARANPDKVARMLIASAPLYDPGDLDTRIPAGQRVLLTPDHHGPAATVEALKDTPTIQPDGGTPDSQPAPGDTTVDSSHFAPTVPRVAQDQQARLAEAMEAQLAATEAAAIPVTSPTDAGSSNQFVHNPLAESFGKADLESLLVKCFKRSEPEFDKLKVDVDKTGKEVLQRSTESFDAGTMLDNVRELSAPLVIVHGIADPLIPDPGGSVWQYLTFNKEDTLLPIPLPSVRHFPMLEHEPFFRLVNDFLEIEDISKLEVKERWSRRTR